MKTISIIGSGGHTRSSLNILKQNHQKYNFNIFDDSYNSNMVEYIDDIQLLGNIKDVPSDSLVLVSIGDNKNRALYFDKFSNQLLKENLFHKTSILEKNVKIGISNQIFAHAYINSYSKIGNNNIINTSSILEHEVVIGNHNHISISAKLCGRVSIGDNCLIGASATIIDKIVICDNVIVGAGAVVTKNITEPGTYVGIPARKIK